MSEFTNRFSVLFDQTGSIALILSLIIALLLTIVLVLGIRIRHIKREFAASKMIDGETGIGNLQFFKYHFKHIISDNSRNQYHLAYIVLDSSYLRSYHGDSSFDEVLKYTASVLAENTVDEEFFARITENGFAFAFPASCDEDAEARLGILMDQLNDFEGMKAKRDHFVFHATIYHLGNQDKNCELLLFNLRKNCNKILGTEAEYIRCDIHAMNRIQEEKKFAESILKGIKNNEFKMYLQFIVSSKTGKIVSAEALSRWDSPEKGLLGPFRYIGEMESAGLITMHDFYMFDMACRQLEAWSNTAYKDLTISCNFTRITLSEDDFVDRLTDISNSYQFEKSKLSIEITEDAIEQDLETAKQNVRKCKALGFRIYLDDLGSGYTSLSNLCDYPIDVVKIDRDILLKTDTNRGKHLFAGIIALAHSLDIEVICEGVETEEQNLLVSDLGCDYMQGWYYSKPIPPEEFEFFLQNFNVKH